MCTSFFFFRWLLIPHHSKPKKMRRLSRSVLALLRRLWSEERPSESPTYILLQQLQFGRWRSLILLPSRKCCKRAWCLSQTQKIRPSPVSLLAQLLFLGSLPTQGLLKALLLPFYRLDSFQGEVKSTEFTEVAATSNHLAEFCIEWSFWRHFGKHFIKGVEKRWWIRNKLLRSKSMLSNISSEWWVLKHWHFISCTDLAKVINLAVSVHRLLKTRKPCLFSKLLFFLEESMLLQCLWQSSMC